MPNQNLPLTNWFLRCTGFILASALSLTSFSQEFHQPLKCHGEIPAEFLKYTKEVIEEVDQTAKTADFNVKASIDVHELLQSGVVLFGDTVSAYITQLADKILKSNHIDEQVSFYVLRSSIFNAFSSDQGFIFITEGAIAGSKNEEELAFIMCHELAHFLEKHNYLSYEKGKDITQGKKSKNADTENKLKAYYKYSRHNEFQADSIGLELYLACGFDKKNAVHGLANLSPESIWNKDFVWSPDYLEDEHFHFPSVYMHLDSMDNDGYRNLFAKKPSKSESDEESTIDSGEYSTHPDWQVRLDTAAKQLSLTDDEIKEIIKRPIRASSEFEAIRLVCHMETLFNYISNASYVRAHYLILEISNKYGSSKELDYYATITLNGMYYKYFHGDKKEQYLFPITYYSTNNNWNVTHMFRFFNVLSDDEWLVLLSRENLKQRAVFKENPTIIEYTRKSIGFLKETMSKSFKNYVKDPPKIVYDFMDEDGKTISRTIGKKELTDLRKAYLRSGFKSIGGPDSLMLVEVFDDSELDEEAEETNFYSRSFDPWFRPMKQNGKLNRKSGYTILVAKPNVQSFEQAGGSFIPTPWLDEQYENQIQDWRKEASEALNMNLISLYHANKESMTTELWNNAYVLESWMKEKFLANSSEVIPFYSNYITDLSGIYSNDYYMYTSVMIFDNKTPKSAVATWLTPFIFPYLTAKKLNKNRPELVIVNVLADLKSNRIVHIQIESYNNRFTQDYGRSHMYDLIFQTKKALENDK